MDNIPLPPNDSLNSTDMWVQEKIYGHRFIPEQEPYMLLLELLSVCDDVQLGTHQAESGQHENIRYQLPHRRKMRFLLFVDRHLESVAEDKNIPDQEKWEIWKERVNKQYGRSHGDFDHFIYLDRNFEGNFEALLQAVKFLKKRELDIMHNRRWTSRFLAINGPDMICTDMRESQREGQNRQWTVDRRFFGRGGELVYLMLNRSHDAGLVGEKIRDRLLNPNDPVNRVAKLLCDYTNDSRSETSIGYLPLQYHHSYDRIAEDWLAILQLQNLPDRQLFDPLFRITSLNLLVYLAERFHEVSKKRNQTESEPILADITNGSDRQFRNLSKEYLNRHRQAAHLAVEEYVRETVLKDANWQIKKNQGSSLSSKEHVEKIFHYYKLSENLSPESALNAVIKAAKIRDKNNANKFLLPLVRNSGLAITRPGVGTWFALDDEMICTLVIANVHHVMELKDFVSRLYERYRIIIGPEEARREYKQLPIGVHNFEINIAALENRMTCLALTRRLSDDCAFVTNPYAVDYE